LNARTIHVATIALDNIVVFGDQLRRELQSLSDQNAYEVIVQYQAVSQPRLSEGVEYSALITWVYRGEE
jgi:hypothetical protein